MFLRLFACCLLLPLLQNFLVFAADPDVGRSIEEIVRSHGFDLEVSEMFRFLKRQIKFFFFCEIHNVTTGDGYILTLHRLVGLKEELEFAEDSFSGEESWYYQTEPPAKKPVIVQHGLFGSSADFLISSPFLRAPDGSTGDNLAFALHLTGRYDVWLSNSR